ncbi:MAG: DUF4276 family protein [Burkholderiales bacterium]
MKLFVEGGGESVLLRAECRRGFSEFLRKAGLGGHMPRVVACGGRTHAYRDFCTAIANGEAAILLVDSEGPIAAPHQQGPFMSWKPWLHLKQRIGDGWDQPDHARDEHCHLMVECMESWFLADRDVLKTFFDPGFRPNALPSASNAIEGVVKGQLDQSLAEATKNCKTKSVYRKGPHSFKILALIDPVKVTAASPWAQRFVQEVKAQMGG